MQGQKSCLIKNNQFRSRSEFEKFVKLELAQAKASPKKYLQILGDEFTFLLNKKDIDLQYDPNKGIEFYKELFSWSENEYSIIGDNIPEIKIQHFVGIQNVVLR